MFSSTSFVILDLTFKFLQEGGDVTHLTLVLAIFFFRSVSSGKGYKSKNQQMGQYQTKNFCTGKKTISKTKKQDTEWGKKRCLQ